MARGTTAKKRKTMRKYLIALLSAALIAGVTLPVSAADEKKSEKKSAAKSSKKKRDTYPFRGTVGSVDGDKLVLKQKSGDRTITVDKKARVMKQGADRKRSKIKLSDIEAGAYVTGMLKKVDGKEVAVAVYERPKPEPRSSKSKGKGKKPSKKKDS
eukprot:TRINITY_DN93211_c0_g1_i1.p1 TRINITY_DN93211_c0_g1~~TRINITY_DN93211_c0_g1_i1.p1  ORF type:complete len:156 (-),score=30.24 TRINITY_DN93211_c0_g1_i1:91-558(-)